MTAIATLKDARITPRKAAEVVSLVRGRTVADALVILENTPRKVAVMVKQAVQSAAANAEHNHGFKPDSLYIAEISVSPGMRMKRFRPVWHGQAHGFERITSHIRVVVDGQLRPVKPVKTPTKEKK